MPDLKNDMLSDLLKDVPLTGISADTRTLKKGDIFVAITGIAFDGFNFIDQAINTGAVAIIAETGKDAPQSISDSNIPFITVDNPRQTLSYLAARLHPKQPEQIFVVTGTNGKTSVAAMAAQLLEKQNIKAASLGTLGFKSDHATIDAHLTTADPVRLHEILDEAAKAGVKALAMEASSHGLDQHRLDGVNITAAAFTNLSQDHLDYHGDMNHYFEAKARLFTDLDLSEKRAVIVNDGLWGAKLSSLCEANNITVETFGTDEDTAQIHALAPQTHGQEIDLTYKGERLTISLPLIGHFQAYNALCAALLINLSADQLNLLETLNPIEGRLEYCATTDTGGHVYVDYAHTPDALENVLKAMRPHTDKRLIILFGCGGDRDNTKRAPMGKACEDFADIVILSDDNPRSENPVEIRKQAKVGCPDAIEIDGRRAGIEHGIAMLEKDDILIIAGKGHEDGQEIKGVKHPFHDPSIVKEILKTNTKPNSKTNDQRRSV